MTEDRIRELKKIAEEKNLTAIFKLARDMRAAQKEYFRVRWSSALKKALALESEFDRLLEFLGVEVEEL